MRKLTCFYLASGVKVNLNKSKLMGIGLPLRDVSSMAKWLKCLEDELTLPYLGMAVGGKPNRASMWLPLIDKLEQKNYRCGRRELFQLEGV